MTYQVSEKVKERFAALVADEKVKKALDFIKDDRDTILDKQCELTLIPAPTHHEAEKAKRFVEMLAEEGLTDCHIDEYGNAVGIWTLYSHWIQNWKSSETATISDVPASLMTHAVWQLCCPQCAH